jgi:hypothetical protein
MQNALGTYPIAGIEGASLSDTASRREQVNHWISYVGGHQLIQPDMEPWLTTLITKTPQEGFELAIKLARMGVKYTQPSAVVRDKLRPAYAENADSLTLASQVVAVHFQTVAAAIDHWR